MITPSAVTAHLKTYLPIYTDKFTALLSVSSAVMGAGNILTINATAHGKTAGNSLVVTSGKYHTLIDLATQVDDTVQFQTTTDHDQTRPILPLDTQTLTLGGFVAPNTAWNDDHTIIDVPNRRNFIVDGTKPTLGGAEYLIENMPTGVYTIASTPTANSLTIDFSDAPAMPTGTVFDFTAISGFRISAAANFERAKAVYSKQTAGEAYCFVIMTDGDVSKDSHTLNDGVAGFTKQDLHLIRVFRNFSTVVFLPTADDLSGATAQDLAYNTIYSSLIACLFGFADTNQVIQYSAVPTSDGPAEYNSAYYAHVYDWQLPTTLVFDDGFLDLGDVAFRDIGATFRLFNDSDAEMTANIDLDEDEL